MRASVSYGRSDELTSMCEIINYNLNEGLVIRIQLVLLKYPLILRLLLKEHKLVSEGRWFTLKSLFMIG